MHFHTLISSSDNFTLQYYANLHNIALCSFWLRSTYGQAIKSSQVSGCPRMCYPLLLSNKAMRHGYIDQGGLTRHRDPGHTRPGGAGAVAGPGDQPGTMGRPSL